MEKDKITKPAFLIQSLATACICFMACQTGFISSWPSYTVANFTSNTTVLSSTMSSVHVSLLGSLPNIGALVASPFCGYIFNTIGRKYATVFFTVPFLISWIIIYFTTDVTLILVAMTIAGIGIAGQNVSLIFISEIAHDSIRGGLTACSASGYFVGILVSFALGGHLSYYQVICTHLILSVICITLLMLLRESPTYLVLVGKDEEAAKAIAFYRQVDVASKEVLEEIAKIKIQLDPRLEMILQGENDPEAEIEPLKEKLQLEEHKKVSSWKFLKNSKSSKRALVTCFIIVAATIMMGSIVMQVFAEPLFKEVLPSMPPNQLAIYLALDFLAASFLCVVIVDVCGRKFLLITTSGASGICTLLLGLQLQFHWAPYWITAALIYIYNFVYTVGCAVVPFILAAEVFLPEVRGLCNSMVMCSVWIVNFITLVIFNPLVESLGMGPVFYIFSIVCFFGAGYSHFYVPETKGLSADAIQLLFLKGKKNPEAEIEPLKEKLQLEEHKKVSSWKFLKNSKSSKRALVTCFIIVAATIMMGSIVMQVFAEPLFKEVLPSMPPNQLAIYLALDFLAASFLCVVIVDVCGRKFLLITTSGASGICTLLLGLQLQFHWAPYWITAALIYIYNFVYTVGCAVVPFILAAEVFLPEVRGLCNSMVMCSVWIVNFITLVIFNPLVESLGMGPVFYIFSIVCFFGAGYSHFYVPETKGLSADAIQLLFLKGKKSVKH